MNVEQLMSALSAHDPDPDTVLAAFHAKSRQRKFRKAGLIGAGVATLVAATVIAGVQLWPTSPRQVIVGPSIAASGCIVESLRDQLAAARQAGASVIVATGSLTGAITDDHQYHQMTLRAVQTLSGSPIANNSTAWIADATGPSGPIPGTDAGALWGTDGRLFAIATPASQAGTTVGPTLRVAPVVGNQVIFSTAGCWGTTSLGLTTQPFHGPLTEVPGSNSYQRANPNDFHAVPLTTVQQLLTH